MRSRIAIVTAAVIIAIAVAGLPAGATYTPKPGELAVSNEMVVESDGCVGGVEAIYGLLPSEYAREIRLQPRADCGVDVWWAENLNIQWSAGGGYVMTLIDEEYSHGLTTEFRLESTVIGTGCQPVVLSKQADPAAWEHYVQDTAGPAVWTQEGGGACRTFIGQNWSHVEYPSVELDESRKLFYRHSLYTQGLDTQAACYKYVQFYDGWRWNHRYDTAIQCSITGTGPVVWPASTFLGTVAAGTTQVFQP